jgi:hypothetical protein
MHDPDVVQATSWSATSMLFEGVPTTWGVVTAVVPQLASAMPAAPSTTAMRHGFPAMATPRLMAFPVLFRHAPRLR